MIHVVLEREYDPPFDKKAWFADDLRLNSCLEARGARWIRSQVSLDGRRTICEFEAPDAESVRIACRIADIAFQRVWVAEVFEPGQDPSAWLEQLHLEVEAAE